MKAAHSMEEIFERWLVRQAVKTLSIPAVISQLSTTACSLTASLFIGQTGSDAEIAAVSVSQTAFLLLNTIANLFGIGGSCLLSWALGSHNHRRQASQAAVFSSWRATGLSLSYLLIMATFFHQLAQLFGATNAYLSDFCTYLHYSIVLGALPTVLVMIFGHLTRAKGESRPDSFGLCLAGIANKILDSIFIFPWGLNMGGADAALATAVSTG